MAELDSEDSSDGALIIDEPNYETIELLDDSDVEVDKFNDDVQFVSSSLSSSCSSTKTGLTCKICSRIFSTNNDLLNHIRKFKGRIGSCIGVTKVKFATKRKNVEDITPKHFIKKKRGRPPKMHTVTETPCLQLHDTVPASVPIIPQNMAIMPPLHQLLVDEIEPEYPCTMCDQVFRHNIGLICHLNAEHSTSTNIVERSTSKLKQKKRIVRKNIQEMNEPDTNPDKVIDLTLLPEVKKDSLLNRMKSYVYSAKNQVICILCNIEFKNTKRALAHVEDKHISDKIECGYCNMKFVYELKLRSHLAKRHKVISVFKCDKCSKLINKEECESHSEKCKEKVNPMKIKSEKDDDLII